MKKQLRKMAALPAVSSASSRGADVTKDISTFVRFPSCDYTFELIDRSIAKYGVDDTLYKKHSDLWKELPRGLSFVYAHPSAEHLDTSTVTTKGVTSLPDLYTQMPSSSVRASSKGQLMHVLAGMYKFGNFDDKYLSNLLSDSSEAQLRGLINHKQLDQANAAPTDINRIWLMRKENGSCFHVSAFRHPPAASGTVDTDSTDTAGSPTEGQYFWHIGSKNSHLIVRDEWLLQDLECEAYSSPKFEFAKCLAKCFHAEVLCEGQVDVTTSLNDAPNSSTVRRNLLEWFVKHPYHSFVGEACLAADPHLVQYHYNNNSSTGSEQEAIYESETESASDSESKLDESQFVPRSQAGAGADKLMFFTVTEYIPCSSPSSSSTTTDSSSGAFITPVVSQCVSYTPMEAHTLFTQTLGMSLKHTVSRLDEIQVVSDDSKGTAEGYNALTVSLSTAHIPAVTEVSMGNLLSVWKILSKSYEFEENSEGAVVYIGVGPQTKDGNSVVQRVFKYKNLYYVIDRSLREAMRRGLGVEIFKKRFDYFHLPVYLYCASSVYNQSHHTPNLNTYLPVSLSVANDAEGGDRSETKGLSFLHYCYAFHCFIDQKIQSYMPQSQTQDGNKGCSIASWDEVGVKYIELKTEFRRLVSREGMVELLRNAGLLESSVGATQPSSLTLTAPAIAVTASGSMSALSCAAVSERSMTSSSSGGGDNNGSGDESKFSSSSVPVAAPAPTAAPVPVPALHQAFSGLSRQIVVAPISIPGLGKSTLLRTVCSLIGTPPETPPDGLATNVVGSGGSGGSVCRYLNQDLFNGNNNTFQTYIRQFAGLRRSGAGTGASVDNAESTAAAVPSLLFLDKCHHTPKVRTNTIDSILAGCADKRKQWCHTPHTGTTGTTGSSATASNTNTDTDTDTDGEPLILWVQLLAANDNDVDNYTNNVRVKEDGGNGGSQLADSFDLAMSRIQSRGLHHPTLVYVPQVVTEPPTSTPSLNAKYQPQPRVQHDPNRKLTGILKGFAHSFEYPQPPFSLDGSNLGTTATITGTDTDTITATRQYYEHVVKLDASKSVSDLVRELVIALLDMSRHISGAGGAGTTAITGREAMSLSLLLTDEILQSHVDEVKRLEKSSGAAVISNDITLPPPQQPQSTPKKESAKLPFQYVGIRYVDSNCHASIHSQDQDQDQDLPHDQNDPDQSERGCVSNSELIARAVRESLASVGRNAEDYISGVEPWSRDSDCGSGASGSGSSAVHETNPERARAFAQSCYHTTLLHRSDLGRSHSNSNSNSSKKKDQALPVPSVHPMQQLAPIIGTHVTVIVTEVWFDEHIVALPCKIGRAVVRDKLPMTMTTELAAETQTEAQAQNEACVDVGADAEIEVYCKNVHPHITYGMRDPATYRGTEGSDRPDKLSAAYSNEMLTRGCNGAGGGTGGGATGSLSSSSIASTAASTGVHVVQLAQPLQLVGIIEKVFY